VSDKPQPPSPGIPEGCTGYAREQLWHGWKKDKETAVYRLRVWWRESHRARGDKPMELLVKDGRMLTSRRASKGVPGEMLALIRRQQDEGKSSAEMRRVMVEEGMIVELPQLDEHGKYETEQHKTSSGGPPLWRNVWRATQVLGDLVLSPHAGVSRAGAETTLNLQLRAIGGPTATRRLEWLASLSAGQRADLAWAVRARGNEIVANPPPWRFFAGRTGSREFLFVDEWSLAVRVRPAISYKAGRAARSCTRTLILRWIGPRTDFVRRAGIETQRQLFAMTDREVDMETDSEQPR
jgi:hypothetical protein